MCVLATTHPEDGGAVHMVIPSQTFANRRTFAKFAKPSTTCYVPSRSLNLRKHLRKVCEGMNYELWYITTVLQQNRSLHTAGLQIALLLLRIGSAS